MFLATAQNPMNNLSLLEELKKLIDAHIDSAKALKDQQH
ncbi:Uncharacterized protein AC509_1316 [Pseudomonas amygdali pv. morsprunorum]|nr:Uncharacterized protein AC509_1316 [Pseudomonas amygdali pv. morsprunorum]